jgi:hypothetical protein
MEADSLHFFLFLHDFVLMKAVINKNASLKNG